MPTTDAGRAREALTDELDTITDYEEMAADSKDEKLKERLKEVADDERVHVGNFARVLSDVDPKAEPKMREGLEEVVEVRKTWFHSFRDMMNGASHFQKRVRDGTFDPTNYWQAAQRMNNRRGKWDWPYIYLETKIRPSQNYYGMNRNGSVPRHMYYKSRLQMMFDLVFDAAEPVTAEMYGIDPEGAGLKDGFKETDPFWVPYGSSEEAQLLKLKKGDDGRIYVMAFDPFKDAFTPLIRSYHRRGRNITYSDYLATPKTTEHEKKGEDTQLVTIDTALEEWNNAVDRGRVAGTSGGEMEDIPDRENGAEGLDDRMDFNKFIKDLEEENKRTGKKMSYDQFVDELYRRYGSGLGYGEFLENLINQQWMFPDKQKFDDYIDKLTQASENLSPDINTRNQVIIRNRPETNRIAVLATLLNKKMAQLHNALGDEGLSDFVGYLAGQLLSEEQFDKLSEKTHRSPTEGVYAMGKAVGKAIMENFPKIVEDSFLVGNINDLIDTLSYDNTEQRVTGKGEALPTETDFGALFGAQLQRSTPGGTVSNKELQRAYSDIRYDPNVNTGFKWLGEHSAKIQRQLDRAIKTHKHTSLDEAQGIERLSSPHTKLTGGKGIGVSQLEYGEKIIPFHYVDQMIEGSRNRDEKSIKILNDRNLRDFIRENATLRQRYKIEQAIEDARKTGNWDDVYAILHSFGNDEPSEMTNFRNEPSKVGGDYMSDEKIREWKLTSPWWQEQERLNEIKREEERKKNPPVTRNISPEQAQADKKFLDDMWDKEHNKKIDEQTDRIMVYLGLKSPKRGVDYTKLKEEDLPVLFEVMSDPNVENSYATDPRFRELRKLMWNKDLLREMEYSGMRGTTNTNEHLGLPPTKGPESPAKLTSGPSLRRLMEDKKIGADFDTANKFTDYQLEELIKEIMTNINPETRKVHAPKAEPWERDRADEYTHKMSVAFRDMLDAINEGKANRGALDRTVDPAMQYMSLDDAALMKGEDGTYNFLPPEKFTYDYISETLPNLHPDDRETFVGAGLIAQGLAEPDEEGNYTVNTGSDLKFRPFFERYNLHKDQDALKNWGTLIGQYFGEDETEQAQPIPTGSSQNGPTVTDVAAEKTTDDGPPVEEIMTGKKEAIPLAKSASFRDMLKSATNAKWKDKGLPAGYMEETLPAYYRTVNMGCGKQAINVYDHQKMPVGGDGISMKTLSGVGPKMTKKKVE